MSVGSRSRGAHRRPAARGGAVARGGTGVLALGGQLLNAGTNVATVYVAAWVLDPYAFGTFVIAFGVVTLVLGACRGLVGSPAVVHLPGVDAAARPALVRSALGFTALVGLALTAALSVLVAPWVDGILLWFAPWITVALLHDLARYVRLAQGQAGAALALDLAWAATQAALIGGWALAGGAVGVRVMATAWGLGALAGLALFVITSRLRPTGPRLWWSATRDVAGWFTAVALLGVVELYATILLAGALLGAVEAGALRAVQLVALQPVMVLGGALLTVLTPAAVRALAAGTSPLRAGLPVAMAVAPLAAVLVVVAVFGAEIVALLFPTQAVPAGLVAPIALQAVLLLAVIPPMVVLRSLRRGRAVFGNQVLRCVLVAVAATAGALLAGPVGLAWALVPASLLGLVALVVQLARADPAVPDPAVPDPAVPDPAVPDPAVPDPAVPDPAAVPATPDAPPRSIR